MLGKESRQRCGFRINVSPPAQFHGKLWSLNCTTETAPTPRAIPVIHWLSAPHTLGDGYRCESLAANICSRRCTGGSAWLGIWAGHRTEPH